MSLKNKKPETRVKTAFSSLLFTLSSLLVFSCLVPLEQPKPAQYTEDGRVFVNVSINASAGRSLTPALAKTVVDYYEVIFYDSVGGRYYRAAFRKRQTGTIRIPAGTYEGFDHAILLAGRYEDRTLLAAGELTAVNDVTSAPACYTIDANTESVTFTLMALEYAPKNAAASDFAIIGPTGYETVADNNHYGRIIDRKAVPYFKIPHYSDNIAAHISIANVPVGASGSPLKLNGTPLLTSEEFSDGVNPSGSFSVSSLSPTASGVKLQGDGGLSLDAAGMNLFLETPVSTGWCTLMVEVPLSAYVTDQEHDVWYLRPGLYNDDLDSGAGSLGGSILLSVEFDRSASSYITAAGVVYRLMDYPEWSGVTPNERAQMLSGTSSSITIGAQTFDRMDITEVIMNKEMAGVTSIGDEFLAYCSNLATVDLSSLSYVTSIGNKFLESCSNLTSLTLPGSPSGLSVVGDYFLFRCSSLTSLNLNPLNRITSVGVGFLSQSGLISVDLRPWFSGQIKDDFLYDCPNLATVDLSGLSPVTSIGNNFLSNCPNLATVDLSSLSSVTSIGDNFLSDCQQLGSLDMGSLAIISSIGKGFLYKCDNLDGVVNMGNITADKIEYEFSFSNNGTGEIRVPTVPPGQVAAYQSKFGGNTAPTRFVSQ